MNGTRQSELVDHTKIDQVPIWLFAGKLDQLCSYEHAVEMSENIPAVKHIEAFPAKGHMNFGW